MERSTVHLLHKRGKSTTTIPAFWGHLSDNAGPTESFAYGAIYVSRLVGRKLAELWQDAERIRPVSAGIKAGQTSRLSRDKSRPRRPASTAVSGWLS